MKLKPLIVLLAFVLSVFINFSLSIPRAEATSGRQVGIWYSTWYTNEGKYIWEKGHGQGSKTQLLGDVNGDGKDDAVTFFDNPGITGYRGAWHVALSNGNGTSFIDSAMWKIDTSPSGDGHGSGSKKQFLAKVNNDNYADAVIYMDQPGYEGRWYVALSNGVNGFGRPQLWKTWHGSGSKNQFMADVNNDNRDDAIAFFDTNSNSFRGGWYVALSNGVNAFTNYGQWKIPNSTYGDGHGSGSKNQFMADVNNDNRDDAIVFFDTTGFAGKWYVALTNPSSTGFSNLSSNPWLDGQGSGSQKQFVADVNGDNRADAIYYFQNAFEAANGVDVPNGAWYKAVATSTNIFQPPSIGSPWKYDHGNSQFPPGTPGHLPPSSNQLVGNVDGDINNTADPLAFVNIGGDWRVLPAEKYIEPARVNLWEGWNLKYRPLVKDTPSIYDSGDPVVIDEHLNKIEAAGVDYLLFDLTNNISTDYILTRAKTVCSRIAAHNAIGGNIKFAVAVGGIQRTQDPETVESEAAFVKQNFIANDPVCAPHYYQYKNKPLLVAYGNLGEIIDKNGSNDWESYPNKTSTNDFTVIPALSELPSGADAYTYPGDTSPGGYPSKTGEGCGTVPTALQNSPSTSRYGDVLGWGLAHGTLGSGPIMSVMPGWENKDRERILRNQLGYWDGFYIKCGWDKILDSASNPEMVVINSFNEYAEKTALEPSDTSSLIDPLDRWPWPNYYWDITVQKISQLKN